MLMQNRHHGQKTESHIENLFLKCLEVPRSYESSKQKTMALSSSEPENMARSEACEKLNIFK